MEPGRYEFGGVTLGEKVTDAGEPYGSDKNRGRGEYSGQRCLLYQEYYLNPASSLLLL